MLGVRGSRAVSNGAKAERCQPNQTHQNPQGRKGLGGQHFGHLSCGLAADGQIAPGGGVWIQNLAIVTEGLACLQDQHGQSIGRVIAHKSELTPGAKGTDITL